VATAKITKKKFLSLPTVGLILISANFFTFAFHYDISK